MLDNLKRGECVLDDRELLDTHARALFRHDGRSRLLTVNEPGGVGAPAARLLLCRARTRNLWRFRADLPEALVEKLEALCADEPTGAEFGGAPLHADEYARLLETHAPVRESEAGPAYYFNEYAEPSGQLLTVTESNAELLRGGFEDFVDELPTWQPFVALVEGGRAVSVCRSARITSAAHEAGVETLPEFRGRGYAKDVTARWARLVRSAGALPLYSTSWENTSSQAVAGKLGLTMYAADFHIT
ncbi:MAG TPA: GNAT family N-acetyltransferase [Pyrinomonadaceae bacterium]|nr:GNAT family N-acetyltransferase [Pyrinomonadaceae bacterium]